MNILYLNNTMHLGGDNKCILKLCKELKSEYKLVIASNGGVLESEFRDLGIKHYHIEDVVNKMPHIIISNVLKLIKIVKEEKIDIIHSHHRMAALTAKIASKFVKVKVIHTQHICVDNKYKLTKVALGNMDVISVSDSVKNGLEKDCFLNKDRITTVYNTIETENENKVVDDRIIKLKEDGHFVIAQVTRAARYKGIFDFVDIAKEVIKENDNIRFVFIGDGPDKDEMQEYVTKNNLDEYVFLLGSKDNVIKHFEYVDLLLLCSYLEGLPLGPIEAFSQKIPAVATNIDGTNEEIENGYNGYLVEPKDIEDFKNKILKIYNDKELLMGLKNNSYDLYNKSFNTAAYIGGHKKVYERVIDKR